MDTPFEVVGRVRLMGINIAQKLPYIEVGKGKKVLLKAWPTNMGIIYLSTKPLDNDLESYPLCPNDCQIFSANNTDEIYITGFSNSQLGDVLAIYFFKD